MELFTGEISDEFETETEETQERSGFVIDDDMKAAWAMRKIDEIERETEKSIEWYENAICKCKERLQRETSYFKALLYEYFQTVPQRPTKTKAVYKLPCGEMSLKFEKSDFAIADNCKGELLSELAAKGSEFIKTKSDVDWAGLKKTLKEIDGQIFTVSEDGEAIQLDNVKIVNKPPEFTVKYKRGDEE